MLGHSPLGTQALGALENPPDTGISLTLAATEARDVFAGAISVSTNLILGATEARDAFAGSLQVSTTATLAATEARDTFSGNLTLSTTLQLAATEARDIFSGAIGNVTNLTLTGVEARDIFSGALSAFNPITLAATEASDTFSGAIYAFTPLTLAGVEEPDIFSGKLSVEAEQGASHGGGGGWGPPRKVREHLRVDDRVEIRALIQKAYRGESVEAEAVVEAAAEFIEQDDAGLQVDWSSLEAAQERLSALLQALASFQAHQAHLAAEEELARAVAHAQAMQQQEDDEIIALLLAV